MHHILKQFNLFRCDATIRVSQAKMRGKVGRSSTLRAQGLSQPKVLDDNPLVSSKTSMTVGGEVDLNIYTVSTTYTRIGKQFFGKCMTYPNYKKTRKIDLFPSFRLNSRQTITPFLLTV